MAKNVLPVDFQDDILAESMNGRRKYQMITNSDGTVSFVDVTEYTQVGSNFGQAQVNATNEAVNESADKNKIIDDKDDLVANSQAGMMAGALAVKAIREELNQNMNIIEVSAQTEQATDMQPGAIGYLTLTFNVPEGYKINNIKSYAIGSWSGMLLQGYSISGNSINFSIYNANPAVHPASIAATVNCSKIN